MKKLSTLGIDLAKNFFQLHGVDEDGRVILKKKLSRDKLLSFISQLPVCTIGMEACGGSNHWAREFLKVGHEVKLMAPQFVKPYVKSNKNDMADAEAICEAVTRKNMRFVQVKTQEAQDIQAIHRIRSRLVASKTALMNEIRGLLHEYGVIAPQGISKLKALLTSIDNEVKLTQKMKSVVAEVYSELTDIEKRITFYDKKIEEYFKTSDACQRIEKIEGVGIITATAMVAAVGNASLFKNGRQFAAYLGIVPKQHSSGGKEKLLGISKRGDGYLRGLLIHGARSVINQLDKQKNERFKWVRKIIERRGHNKACVALANKNARIICTLLKKGCEYRDGSDLRTATA